VKENLTDIKVNEISKVGNWSPPSASVNQLNFDNSPLLHSILVFSSIFCGGLRTMIVVCCVRSVAGFFIVFNSFLIPRSSAAQKSVFNAKC